MKPKTTDKNRCNSVLRTLATYATVVLCASSCTRWSDLKVPQHASGEIAFTATLTDATTRAVSDIDFATHGIYIGGYYTTGKIADAVAANVKEVYPNVFNKEEADNQNAVPLVKETTTEGVKKYILKTIKWSLSEDTYLNYFAWGQNKTKDAVSGIVNATTDTNDKGYPWLEIVNPNEVNSQVDIVGARHLDQQNNVVVSAVDLNFRHLLSKLTFKVKNSTGTVVTFTKMNMTYNKVFSKARFTFDSDATKEQPGAFGNHNTTHVGTNALNIKTVGVDTEVTAPDNMLLIPQSVEQGFMKIELVYTITSGTEIITQTKTVSLPAGELLQGVNHIYTLTIKADGITVNTAQIADWIVDGASKMPVIPGPCSPDVLLLLDGYDKPYQHTDGKWYWLDRSGWNRHCEIPDITVVVYNSAEHYYEFNNSYIDVPALPRTTVLSADIVCQNGTDSKITYETFAFFPSSANLGADRRFIITHGWSGGPTTVLFDIEGISGLGRVTYPSNAAEMQSMQMWTFQRQDKGVNNIFKNAAIVATGKNPASTAINLTYINNKIGNYTGNIAFVKVSKKLVPPKEIVATYQECMPKYGIKIPDTYLPPVKDGLIFCYDGRSGIKTVGSDRYWEDQISKNDAKITGNGISYNTNDKYFYCARNDNASYMQMVYNVTIPNDFTMEIVLKPDGRADGSPVYWGIAQGESSHTRVLYMHMPYATGNIYIDSPGKDRYNFGWPSSVGGETDIRTVAVRRQHRVKSECFMANRMVSSGNANTDITADIGECDIMKYFGQKWGGRIYAIRLYNRVLTDSELTQNYNFNKSTFKTAY